ncbi:MAG TPA: hypothetical protein VJ860_09325 [Polyangia bacterium]|jgi:hypothetical protein|nr:hypothetical protein [Polyangia bacterium]
MTLTAGACGKGLFTIPVPTGDGGLQADEATPTGDDAPGLPAADARSDQQLLSDAMVDTAKVDIAIDAPVDTPVDGPVDVRVPDSAPDGPAPGASITQVMDSPPGKVTLGDATVSAAFSVTRGTFAQRTNVTLSLVTLALPNDDAGLAAPSGAIGPVFSLSKTDELGRDATLQNPATLALTFSLADSSIPAQRVKLAYFNTQSDPNLWIAVLTASYDPATRTVTGDVYEFTGTRLFAPVESCTNGQTCPDPMTCGGEACQ